MKGENYRAWEIDFNEFDRQKTDKDRLSFLVRFAVLAPSSHNSQPWRFEVLENRIVVRPDIRRALPKSDANHRQLFISLGCAIENLLVAADYYGSAATADYRDDGAVISFQKEPGEAVREKNHLIFSIPTRHTNRNPYESRIPDRMFMAWMKNLTNDEIQIDCITEEQTKNKIADIVIAAGIAAMNDRGFREELSCYVKSNITKAYTGMPMFGFGMPLPLSLLAPFVLKRFNINKLSRKQDEKILKEHTPMMAVISTKEDDHKAWMRVGQVYERIALDAERDGIKTAPMAAAVQIGEFYRDLQNALNIPWRPQMFFRIGYAQKTTDHSPRLFVEDVII